MYHALTLRAQWSHMCPMILRLTTSNVSLLNCVYEESREPSVDILIHCHNSDGSAVNYLTIFAVRGPKASMAVQLR